MITEKIYFYVCFKFLKFINENRSFMWECCFVPKEIGRNKVLMKVENKIINYYP